MNDAHQDSGHGFESPFNDWFKKWDQEAKFHQRRGYAGNGNRGRGFASRGSSGSGRKEEGEGGSRPNPGEAKRWMKQAEANLKAASEMR